MRAVYVETPDRTDPAAAVVVGDVPAPASNGGVTVEVVAGALNMHDVWLLRGVGVGALPLVLGSDAAGRTSAGREVVIYPVVPAPSPSPAIVKHGVLLNDVGRGVFAERVTVAEDALVDKPEHLDFAAAATLPTAWLTAYRMLTTKAGLQPGQVVLVQGAGGGVATAAVMLAKALGAEVVVTSRSAEKRERALALGADVALETGARLPDLVDIVVETVGPATWTHSTKSIRAGGAIVVCGGSTGFTAELDLPRLFAREIRVLGSTMGTLEEFRDLVGLVAKHRLDPVVDSLVDLDAIASQVRRMVDGTPFGKLCVRVR
ncbi:MAG: zinc-binding dehydrogenase [Nocardioidaceae bacterium]